MGPRGPEGGDGFVGAPGEPGDGGINSPGVKGERGEDGYPGNRASDYYVGCLSLSQIRSNERKNHQQSNKERQKSQWEVFKRLKSVLASVDILCPSKRASLEQFGH